MVRAATFALALAVLTTASHADSWTPLPASAERAAEFIKSRASVSPTHDGAPLRDYEIRDLDHDGTFEVLEHSSAVEERATGYLAIEYGPPTYWVTVYKLENGEFVEATASFRWFLKQRQSFYEHWVEYFRTNPPSQREALQEAVRNLERVNRLLKPGAA